jgi:hypothetical protein
MSREVLPGVHLFCLPPPTGDKKLKLEGWREGIEEHGQDLWRIYHWVVWAQNGSTHGIYRLRDWLEKFNVPDKTNGAHWQIHEPEHRHDWIDARPGPGAMCHYCGAARSRP